MTSATPTFYRKVHPKLVVLLLSHGLALGVGWLAFCGLPGAGGVMNAFQQLGCRNCETVKQWAGHEEYYH